MEGTVSAPPVIAVVGAGRMGSGIAQVFLQAGWRALLIEANAEAGRAAIARVKDGLAKGVERGAAAVDPSGLRLAEGIRDIPPETAIVIEAVPELPDLKQRLLGDLSRALGPATIIATNTSSISIDLLASVVTSPERFVGLHFFNPVPISRLLEIVKGSATSEATIASALDWARAIGKQPIVVGDSPGFASSRLGVLLGLEAIRMVEEGVGSAEDIDLAMTLGYGHATGPLKSTDIIGLDVRLGIARYLHEQLGERFAPPALLVQKVADGHLGRKSGQGFYPW